MFTNRYFRRPFMRFAVGLAILVNTASHAAMSVTYNVNKPSPVAIAERPELADANVFDFFATTDSDILIISMFNLESEGTIFNHPRDIEPTDAARPNPFEASVFPSYEYDSWIELPSQSLELVSPKNCEGLYGLESAFAATGCEFLWFDLSDDGPQTDFHFARFTVLGSDHIEFDSRFQLSGSPLPNIEYENLSVAGYGRNLSGVNLVPEPVIGLRWPALTFAVFFGLRVGRKRR